MVLVKFEQFFYFQISHGSLATGWKWGGNLYQKYMESFLVNLLLTEFRKSFYVCPSYGQKLCIMFLLGHSVLQVYQRNKELQQSNRTCHPPKQER